MGQLSWAQHGAIATMTSGTVATTDTTLATRTVNSGKRRLDKQMATRAWSLGAT